MNYINNLGEFDSLADVWKEYPYGGKEGDYVVINGVNVAWNKYTTNWGADTGMPDVNNEVNGDFLVKRDLRVGGEIINKDLKWIKEATVLNKGYFRTVNDLKRSYPVATAGSKAYVGSDYPYAIYLWDGKNAAWVDSGEYFDDSLKNKGYFATVEALQAAYPIAVSGSKAYVGVTYPFAIYLWDATTSTWMDSGETGGEESVDLGDYYTKKETDAKVAELESEGNRNRIYLEDIDAVIAELPMNTTTWQRTLYISLNAGDVIHITPILSGITSLDGVYLYFADGEREAIYSWKDGRTEAVNINKKVTSIGFYYSAGSPTTDYVRFHLANRAVLEKEFENIHADIETVKSMSDVSYINKNIFLELGGLNATGGATPVNDRVRSMNYVSAPITIRTNDAYMVKYVCRYKVDASGKISFDSEIYVDNPIWQTIDTSYVYKIVFGKKSNAIFEQSEFSEIISEYDSEYEQISKRIASEIGVISSYVDSYNISFAVDVAKLSIINTKVHPFKAKAGDSLIINFLYSDILSDIAGFYLVNADGTTEAIYSPPLTTEILLTKDIVGFKYYIDASNIVADGVITTRIRNRANLRDIAEKLDWIEENGKNLVRVNAKNKGFYSNGAFIEYSDGYSTNSENCGRWRIMTAPSYKKIHATLGFNALTDLAIGFYKDVVIHKDAYIKEVSVPSKYGVQTYDIDIPSEAKMIVVLNRNGSLPADEVSIEISMEIKDFVESELSASDYSANLVVPNWYKEYGYLDNKIKRINDLVRDCAGHGDAFIFVTDEHIDYLAKNFRSPALIKYIMDKCPISKVFHGGDCCDGQDDLLHFFVDSLKATSEFGFHSVMGNHEYKNAQTDSSLYSYFSWFNKDQVGSENDRNYYYVDNLQQKIRYIVLNAFAQSEKAKNEDVNGDGTLSEVASYGYENEQMEWLNNALDIDSTWTIIVVTHVLADIRMADDSIYYDSNAASAYRILNEHNASGKAKIAFVIQGHTHRDRLILSDGKIPIIITTCDACVAYENDINVDRTPYTINEQAFDVVVLDKKKRQAIAVRIGAPALDGVNGVAGSAVEERVITW